MRDSFGVTIEPGDYILSASTTRGRVKVGTAKQGNNGLLMTVDLSATYGALEDDHPKTGQLGCNVVVLRKADGTVPAHIGYSDRILIDGKWREIADPPEFAERHEHIDFYDVTVYREGA
jgi:hypothetical protein